MVVHTWLSHILPISMILWELYGSLNLVWFWPPIYRDTIHMISMAMLCQPLRKFPIDEIPDLKIPIGFENSYRNSYKI
jgi:hypothetical protein